MHGSGNHAPWIVLLILCSIHPEMKIHMDKTFVVHKDKSLKEATQEAYKVFVILTILLESISSCCTHMCIGTEV